jgi:hypothetical protein
VRTGWQIGIDDRGNGVAHNIHYTKLDLAGGWQGEPNDGLFGYWIRMDLFERESGYA